MRARAHGDGSAGVPDVSPRGPPFGAVARPRRAGRACYRRAMSPEALTSIATGIAFAALHVGLFAELRADMKHGYTRLRCSVALVNQGEHSQRRAAAVVGYIVRNFTVDGSLISSKGMGERQLLDNDNPEAAVNRRVENVRAGAVTVPSHGSVEYVASGMLAAG